MLVLVVVVGVSSGGYGGNLSVVGTGCWWR